MKIVHTSEVEWSNALTRGKFEQRRKELGGERLRAGMWQLPPGKTSFPLHVHHVTEEAMFVLSGRAKIRSTEGETAIAAGDFISFPAGGAPHQLVNDGDEPCVYLAM